VKGEGARRGLGRLVRCLLLRFWDGDEDAPLFRLGGLRHSRRRPGFRLFLIAI
jgi:hypothetical protein